jgi:hypothetical protein
MPQDFGRAVVVESGFRGRWCVDLATGFIYRIEK